MANNAKFTAPPLGEPSGIDSLFQDIADAQRKKPAAQPAVIHNSVNNEKTSSESGNVIADQPAKTAPPATEQRAQETESGSTQKESHAQQEPKTQMLGKSFKGASKKKPTMSAGASGETQMLTATITKELFWKLEDRMYIIRREYGSKVSKNDIIRDGICNFVYGCDVRCPNGHRFIITDVDDSNRPKTVCCPCCRCEFPLDSYAGVFLDGYR